MSRKLSPSDAERLSEVNLRAYRYGKVDGDYAASKGWVGEVEGQNLVAWRHTPCGGSVLSDGQWDGPYSPSELVYFAMVPDQHGQRTDANDFWNLVAGDDREAKENLANFHYLRGFFQGVVEYFDIETSDIKPL